MDFFQSSRQKKHKSAIQKTQHKRSSKRISKRTIEFSKQKGIMKQARRQEQIGWSERTFFCNVCKNTYINSVCRCNWCGAKSKSYKNCLYGIDICEYHNGDFNNVGRKK